MISASGNSSTDIGCILKQLKTSVLLGICVPLPATNAVFAGDSGYWYFITITKMLYTILHCSKSLKLKAYFNILGNICGCGS